MNKRILVVDDEARVQQFAARVLREMDEPFEVLGARDGREALTLAHSQPPDLILLDIGLPVRDGWGVLSTLRASAATRNIPIMLISGRDTEECRERVRLYGAADFMQKPFRPAELRARVQRILARSAKNDPLTGLPGPQAFEAEVTRRLAEKFPSAVLRIGIEGFKRYADFHGAEKGDKVLLAITGILKDAALVCTTDGFVGRKTEGLFALVARPFEARCAAMRIASRFELALKNFSPVEKFTQKGVREEGRRIDQLRLDVVIEENAAAPSSP